MTNHPITQSPNHPISIYPYILQPRMREMVWGGRALENLLGKSFAPGKMIGETWEAWDGCTIANGAHRGMALGKLLEQDASAILGATAAAGARLPLLFKFIDAHQDLSVQVHPDDVQAQRIENYPYGKTEAWYIIHAEPGARLIHGFKDDVDAARVSQCLTENRLPDLLADVPVQSGDVVFVPAGTVHAIRQGIVVAEIQENSDITYRLYDWGRASANRPLHIAQSMQVAEFKRLADHTIPRLTIRHAEFDQHFLVACRYFSLELLDMRAPKRDIATNDKFHIVSILRGAANITFEKSSVAARQGQTMLIPARLAAFGIEPTASPCQILRAYVPDLRTDVIAPLTRASHRPAEIARLGGATPRHNDLLQLI